MLKKIKSALISFILTLTGKQTVTKRVVSFEEMPPSVLSSLIAKGHVSISQLSSEKVAELREWEAEEAAAV